MLLVGLGGLGAPAGLYLAAAGVGRIGLCDPDQVSLSNLQRQVLYATDDVGRPKAAAAAERLRALNPHVETRPHAERFDARNGAALARDYDLVLDGTDSFEARYAVNAACLAATRPLISGALGRWTGQVAGFTGRPCYRCLVPDIPPAAERCAETGVMGALPGIIGACMALEAVKRLTGAGEGVFGRLLIFDGLTLASRVARVEADPACPACGAG